MKIIIIIRRRINSKSTWVLYILFKIFKQKIEMKMKKKPSGLILLSYLFRLFSSIFIFYFYVKTFIIFDRTQKNILQIPF